MARYHLVVQDGPDAGACVQVGAKAKSVGRDPDADLRLADRSVSRRHLILTATAEGLRVEEVAEPRSVRVLTPGQIVRIGETTLLATLVEEPPPAVESV